MVCGVWSQADLEEEGASCEVVARHALSRWIQAGRWAWGQRTTVTAPKPLPNATSTRTKQAVLDLPYVN